MKSTKSLVTKKKLRLSPKVYRPRPTGGCSSSETPSLANGRLSPQERHALLALAALLPLHQQPQSPGAMRDPRRTIASATCYIQQLTNTVIARVRNGTLPEDALSNLAIACELKSTVSSNGS